MTGSNPTWTAARAAAAPPQEHGPSPPAPRAAHLAQAAVAIATAPKSPAIIAGIDAALEDVRRGQTGSVPMHLRDAHYPGAKAFGNGHGYLYPHDFEHGVLAQQYLPEEALGAQYYRPTVNGFEQIITNRLTSIREITKESGGQP